jgi:hypothetical protein
MPMKRLAEQVKQFAGEKTKKTAWNAFANRDSGFTDENSVLPSAKRVNCQENDFLKTIFLA